MGYYTIALFVYFWDKFENENNNNNNVESL